MNTVKPHIVLNPYRHVFIDPAMALYICQGDGLLGFGSTPKLAYSSWVQRHIRARLHFVR